MVLARPTILGQSQSGKIPKVAPLSPRKSKASDTVLVSSADKRSRVGVLVIAVPFFVYFVKYFTAYLICIFLSIDDCDMGFVSDSKQRLSMSKIDFRNIRQLWMFLAVAEECHFGRAAKRLNMSQPPLTQQIKALELSLGMVLFDRSRQGTQLSAAGAAILPVVRKFATQLEQLEQSVSEVATGQSGVLHVGAITSAMLETVTVLNLEC